MDSVCLRQPDRLAGGRWVCIWARRGIEARHAPIGGEKERCTGVLLGEPRVLVIGTVLPWRRDNRRAHYRGAAAFSKSIETQSRAWRRAMDRHAPAACVVAGDWNQELDRDGPVGTKAGKEAMKRVLRELDLTCVTGGDRDPLKRWRASIDHIAVSSNKARSVCGRGPWPKQYPLPRNLTDHHCVSIEI